MSSKPIWEKFLKIVERNPKSTAIIESKTGEMVEFYELERQATRWKKLFEILNINFVVFLGQPKIEQAGVPLACAATAKCFVPLNSKASQSVLKDILDNIGQKSLVFLEDGFDSTSIELGSFEMNGEVLYLYNPSIKKRLASKIPFLITYTSGSTGEPKGIYMHQNTKLKRTEQSINLFKVSKNDVILCASPIFHSLGQRHYFLAMITGATLLISFPFVHDDWIKAVNTYKPTFSIPVSTHLKSLQSYILHNPNLLDSFKTIITSSAPADPLLKEKVIDIGRFNFWEIYGMTETACVTAIKYVKNKSIESLGRPINGSNIKIKKKKKDTVGEILVESDCLADGYFRNKKLWKRSFLSSWFRSGDLGYIDPQNELRYMGRINESFSCGGLLVYPDEVVTILNKMPNMIDCHVVGVDHKLLGKAVGIAWIGRDISKSDVLKFARSNLPKHQWPVRLERFKKFPLLGSGKVDRKKIAIMLEKNS